MKDVVLRGGPPVHPYVYSKRILRADRSVSDGDLVCIKTREGRAVGWGFAHRSSIVAIRVLTWNPDIVPDEDWLRAQVRSAKALREDVLGLPRVTNAWRAIHSEGDGLSGLVVDRYAGVAVASLFSLGWHRRFSEVQRVLREELGLDEVVPRVDRRTSEHEGFECTQSSDGEAVEIEEHGVRYLVNPHGGHKTGFFLDQRENRRMVAELARGRTVFDGMTYTGGFAVAAAKGGAKAVTAMDLDEEAVVQVGRNAARNGVNVAFEHGDVFHALRAMKERPASERPEVLIVDPPKWAKDRGGLGLALRRYGDLNRLALEAVRPGGLVCTSSCSGLVSEEEFLRMLRGASFDSRRALRLVHVGGAGGDHPVAANFPESRYLKCVIAEVGAEGSGPGNEDRPP
ncbi:MAG: class I SAM-dependent rRNA methyltransferase, partial [Planctomycetota bacterium]|nr:class I SAM-dependent rRNA methyltransferase [Planctomycetota bacterium]